MEMWGEEKENRQLRGSDNSRRKETDEGWQSFEIPKHHGIAIPEAGKVTTSVVAAPFPSSP